MGKACLLGIDGIDYKLRAQRGMMARNIVIGAKIKSDKHNRARELRQNMTPGEKVLWDHLRTKKFKGFHFRRQQVIDGYIADFYCHAAGLVIEVDGLIHDSQKEYDAERDQALLAHGLRVLRVSEDVVISNIDSIL